MLEKWIKNDTKKPQDVKTNSKNYAFSGPGLADCAKRLQSSFDTITQSQYVDGNMGTEAEQQMLLKIDKVPTPYPMSH